MRFQIQSSHFVSHVTRPLSAAPYLLSINRKELSMVRAVVFHYNDEIRENVVDAFRHAGFITYDAIDPQRALTAAWTYRPHIVITDFPALLQDGGQSRSLTEAIRQTPALNDIAIISLSGERAAADATNAIDAGASATLPSTTPVADIIQTVYELTRRPSAATGPSTERNYNA
jgi:CheY-like chemotaxis protein